MFVATRTIFFVAASIILSRQKTCFVATKMLLVADSRHGKMKERMLLMLSYNATDEMTVIIIVLFRGLLADGGGTSLLRHHVAAEQVVRSGSVGQSAL